jgi:aarF domain-containing kinase
LNLNVELKEGAKPEAAGAAIAMWLFDGKVEKLPGGCDIGELSPNSPVKEIKVFPLDLVLVVLPNHLLLLLLRLRSFSSLY